MRWTLNDKTNKLKIVFVTLLFIIYQLLSIVINIIFYLVSETMSFSLKLIRLIRLKKSGMISKILE